MPVSSVHSCGSPWIFCSRLFLDCSGSAHASAYWTDIAVSRVQTKFQLAPVLNTSTGSPVMWLFSVKMSSSTSCIVRL